MTNVERHLLWFFEEWDTWRATGASSNGFWSQATRSGLCVILYKWCCDHQLHRGTSGAMMRLLERELEKAAGSSVFPFNSDGGHKYMAECAAATIHLNPKRIEFVQIMIKKLRAKENKQETKRRSGYEY